MKHKLLILAMAVGMAGSVCLAEEIRFGDSLETVIAVLGQPDGYMRIGNRSLLCYDRGRIELEDNQVVSAALISPQAAAELRVERLRREELARQAAATRAAEGQALRDEKLADPLFLALPASSRIAYWQAFMRNYPGVSVGMDYEVAQSEVQAQESALRAEADRARELAELQERAFAAEQRAADAEARARQTCSTFVSYSYPVLYRSSHFVHPPKKPFCSSEPPRHERVMEHRPRQLPRYCHVNTGPMPLDYSRGGQGSGSFFARW